MIDDFTVHPDAVQPLLAGLGLADRREPALLYAREHATQWRIVEAGVDWQQGVAVCLMALSYQWTWLDDLTDAIGVWLPEHRAVMITDRGMRCHLLSLDDHSTPQIPVPDWTLIAGELRGLLGSALGRPGRYHRLDPPMLVTTDPAGVDGLLRPHLDGVRLLIVTPEHAQAAWAKAVKIYVLHDALDEVIAAEPVPRADVTILAPDLTPAVREAATALRTDAMLRWPAAAAALTGMLRRHQQMQALSR